MFIEMRGGFALAQPVSEHRLLAIVERLMQDGVSAAQAQSLVMKYKSLVGRINDLYAEYLGETRDIIDGDEDIETKRRKLAQLYGFYRDEFTMLNNSLIEEVSSEIRQHRLGFVADIIA